MAITLHLPPELETKLAAEASGQGVPLSDYVLHVLSNGGQRTPSILSGTELVRLLAAGRHCGRPRRCM